MKNISIIKKEGIKDVSSVESVFIKHGFNISYDITDNTDLLLSLGGDGTLLRAVHMVAGKKIPILGFNFGRLGFLTSEAHKEIDKVITYLKNKKFYIEERTMLYTVGYSENKEIFSEIAMNEIVIRSSQIGRLANFEIRLDDNFVSECGADGIMVATPTGSTAYSLSAGGPIVEPEMDLHILTPICPHSLTQRPLIYNSGKVATIKLSHPDSILVSIDGQIEYKMPEHSEIKIFKSKEKAKLIRFHEEGFYNVIREKLYWGKK